VADASSIYDGWQDETARASSAASERALVAGQLRGDVNGGLVLAPPAQRVRCSSAHACSGSSNQGSADYCSGRLQIKRNQSIIALRWRPALGTLTCTGRRQRSERRSPSTDFALPPGSPSGPGTHTRTRVRRRSPARQLRPRNTRLARRGLTFRSADVQACCLPSCFCFIARTATESSTPSRTHAHYRCHCCCSPLSLVRPLACLPSGSPVAPPVSAGHCFSPTAIWDLKCSACLLPPAFLRSLEHPYHRQNFFAVHSLAPWIALPTNKHLECCPFYRSAFARRHSLLQRPSLNANRLERHLTPSD
jgi:hypothetical protein